MEKEQTVYFVSEQKFYNDRGSEWSEIILRPEFGFFETEEEGMITVNKYCNEKRENVKAYKLIETKMKFGKQIKIKHGQMKFVFD